MGAAGRHPHFISPLSWHTSVADGLVTARESARAVLLIVSRQSCGGSRALVEKTIGKKRSTNTSTLITFAWPATPTRPSPPSPRWWRGWRNTIEHRCACTCPPTGR